MRNEIFGWCLITFGFLSGMLLGLYFDREAWLGGYASYRRRLIRLGHIALLGLGILNILFDVSRPRLGLPAGQVQLAGAAMMIGGISMPLCCAAAAWRPALKPLFAVPVISLIAAGVTVIRGLGGP